jgi:hypothetical protein
MATLSAIFCRLRLMKRSDTHRCPSDTRPTAYSVQIEYYRRLSPEERTALAVEMSEEARLLTLDGIKRRFPEWDEARCQRELYRRIYGDELFDLAWGASESVDR